MEMMRRMLGSSLGWTSKNVQAELEVQSKSSPSLPRSPGLVCTKMDVQIAYGLEFGRSRYVQKANEMAFPMALV